jgi:uncharacterized protein YceK
MKRIKLAGLYTIATILICSGCATIINGTTQKVGVSSSPTGATVTIADKTMGETPLFAELSRKENHVVAIELAGYQKAELTLTRGTSGWVWGNIVFGGLIGLIVDASAGGMYTLTPEQLTAELKRNDTKASQLGDSLFILTVLKPDPSWKKIGNLTAK